MIAITLTEVGREVGSSRDFSTLLSSPLLSSPLSLCLLSHLVYPNNASSATIDARLSMFRMWNPNRFQDVKQVSIGGKIL